jgi:putative transposase
MRTYTRTIIGFLQPIISFVYSLVIGGVDRKSYIQMIEQEAADASKTGRTRVIVQENGPIHRCKQVHKLWPKWESEGGASQFCKNKGKKTISEQ